MRRKLCFVLLIILLLSVFPATFLAEDNAQAGSGSVQDSVSGFGWYSPSEYLWKVTLFVGKTDQVTKQSDLMNEFYCVGTVIIKKTGWNVSSSVKFGTATKVDYYSGTPMAMETSPEIISDSNCPAIPMDENSDLVLITMIDKKGHIFISNYKYDCKHNLLKTEDYRGLVIEYTYNRYGKELTRKTYHKDNPNSYMYSEYTYEEGNNYAQDGLNDSVETVFASGEKNKVVSDLFGNPTVSTYTDKNGNTRTISNATYDSFQ